MLSLSDEELVARCKKELPTNTRSYEELVQRYMNRIYSIVFRVILHKEEAEDITQEVLVKVYHGIKKFEYQSSFSTWLYRIATNSALDALDKTQRHSKNTTPKTRQNDTKKAEEIDPLSLLASPVMEPEERAIQSELRECINGVLKKLDREQARLLIMRDFDDLGYDEIARLLEVGLSAVKMRIHRSRLAFQHIFNQFCGGVQLAHAAVEAKGTSPKAKMQKEASGR